MEVVLDPKKWFCGRGYNDSRLLTRSGMMCCLGFVSLEVGISKDEILDHASPTSAPRAFHDDLIGLGIVATSFHSDIVGEAEMTGEMVDMNDLHPNMSVADRVENLNGILEKYNSTLRFKLKED